MAETLVTHVIGKNPDGSNVVKNFFFNDDKTNYMVKAHSYFTKDERKQARLHHKLNSNND